MDLPQRVSGQAPCQQTVYVSRSAPILHGHVQQKRAVQIFRLSDVVFDVGAVIGDGAIDIAAAAHEVTKLAAETISNGANLAVALLQSGKVAPRVLHVANRDVVIEIVIKVERLAHMLWIAVGQFDASLLPPE